jgi:hypothetical protein
MKQCTQFEEKEGSGLTGAASPRRRSRSRGARRWSAGEEVEGAGEVVDEHRGVEGEVFPVETELEDGRSGWSSMRSRRPKWRSKVMTGEGVSEGEKWRSFRAFGLV